MSRARRYLDILQERFGRCDHRFIFCTVLRSVHPDGHPQTYYPEGYHEKGGCRVDIQISHCAYDCNRMAQASWQIAHECVHLLDLCIKVQANVLEEGIASWFQNEPSFHTPDVQSYICTLDSYPDHYTAAMSLGTQCVPDLMPLIRRIRLEGVRLKEIQPNQLMDLALSGKTTSSVINQLCEKFGN